MADEEKQVEAKPQADTTVAETTVTDADLASAFDSDQQTQTEEVKTEIKEEVKEEPVESATSKTSLG